MAIVCAVSAKRGVGRSRRSSAKCPSRRAGSTAVGTSRVWSAAGPALRLYVYVALAEAFEVQPGELLGVEEFDREFSAEQRMLLRVVEQLGLAPHDAAARLVASKR